MSSSGEGQPSKSRALALAFERMATRLIDMKGDCGIMSSSAGREIASHIIQGNPHAYSEYPDDERLRTFDDVRSSIDGVRKDSKSRWAHFVSRHILATDAQSKYPPLLAATKLTTGQLMLHKLGSPPPSRALDKVATS